MDSNAVKKGGNDEDRTSGDCISRQAAKDIFTELYGISAISSVFDKYEWADICETTANELPPVQPEQRWIPVTEILPENDDKVLITHSHGISMAWWNGRYWTGSMIKKYKTVMAWMPLPEPYQGGGDT